MIHFPNEVIKQIQEHINNKENYKKTVNKFYDLLNNIFFDKKGNILTKEFKDKDINVTKLKQICQEIKSVGGDPSEIFGQYKISFISNEEKKLNSESEKNLIKKKLSLFMIKLGEILKK